MKECFKMVSAVNMLCKKQKYLVPQTIFSLDEAFQNAGKMNYSSPLIVHFFQIKIRVFLTPITLKMQDSSFSRLWIRCHYFNQRKDFFEEKVIFPGR